MSNAAKKKPPEFSDIPDLPVDREEGLAQNFEDPGLDGIVLDFSEPGNPASVLNEAADAIHELIGVPEENLDMLQALSENVPVTVEDGSLDGLQANARWEMAAKLFDLVVCDRPFSEMMEGVLKAIVDGLNAEAGSILEFDSESKEFFFRASVGGGDAEQLKSFRVPANKGIVGHVAESRQTVLLKDLASDEMQLRAISAGTGFDTRTCLAAPIVITNQLYGVIELFNRHAGGSFHERDVEFLEQAIRMAVKIIEVRFLTAELARRAG
ncbi:MAG: GAF domain-containing protein [Bacteriovoracia bacterium]